MDGSCSVQVGLCVRGQCLGYFLVDTQSQFQVTFDSPVCTLRKNKLWGEKYCPSLNLEAISKLFKNCFLAFPLCNHLIYTCAKALPIARFHNVFC